jgi:cobalt-zinc-cadmium efflux system outer membrane protein
MRSKSILNAFLLVLAAGPVATNPAQQPAVQEPGVVLPGQAIQQKPPTPTAEAQLIDEVDGLTADNLVRYALDHNGELRAALQMIAQAEGRLHQAGLRPNPIVETNYQKAITSPDNNFTIGAELPLELAGRRSARVAVAERELEMRKAEAADFERKLTAEVRARYADVLAADRNLRLLEDLLRLSQESHRLVRARVELGKSAPLEQNTLLVELNRIRAARAQDLGKVEVALLDLKRTIGMPPEQPLQLNNGFEMELKPPALADAIRDALASRPDLAAARAAESLAQAQIEQARVEGKVDASIFANYQRMNFGFSERGFDNQGSLVPVTGIFHNATFGVRFTLPIKNKNQGAIEAAVAIAEGARQRREFGEIAVRDEVASAYARLGRAGEALALYRDGVVNQATRNLDVIRQTYSLGQRSLIDYIAEQRRYKDIEMGYTELLKEYLDSMTGLQAAIGRGLH